MRSRPFLLTALIWQTFAANPSLEELVGEATHIFVMTRDHKRLIELLFPEAAEKTYLLREFEPGRPGRARPDRTWPRNLRTMSRHTQKGSSSAPAIYRKSNHDNRFSCPRGRHQTHPRNGRPADRRCHPQGTPSLPRRQLRKLVNQRMNLTVFGSLPRRQLRNAKRWQ